MKQILLSIIFCSFFVYAKSQSAEKLINNYYNGFERKDWNLVAAQLAEDFTFTSPNGDDHLTLAKYKEKCWGTALKFFKTIEFQKILADGNTAFAMYNITTTDNKIFHNVEYYTFSNGKIKSIETFFGTGTFHFGNSANVK
jgi:ketosteroid isomerase-like protein